VYGGDSSCCHEEVSRGYAWVRGRMVERKLAMIEIRMLMIMMMMMIDRCFYSNDPSSIQLHDALVYEVGKGREREEEKILAAFGKRSDECTLTTDYYYYYYYYYYRIALCVTGVRPDTL